MENYLNGRVKIRAAKQQYYNHFQFFNPTFHYLVGRKKYFDLRLKYFDKGEDKERKRRKRRKNLAYFSMLMPIFFITFEVLLI